MPQLIRRARNRAAFVVAALAAVSCLTNAASRLPIQHIHPGGLEAAREHAFSILAEQSNVEFQDVFRLTKREFGILVEWLRQQGAEDGRHIQLEQRVLMFLYILAQNATQRQTACHFLVAQSTVAAAFDEMLPLFVRLHQAYVRLPEDSYVSPEIEFDKYPDFTGCIGAIGGCIINCFVPKDQQLRWFNAKKKVYGQNVLAAVRFDGTFSYVLAGAEGSIHDSQLYNLSLNRGFRIPRTRYYLADEGFGCKDRQRVVVPYGGLRYHLPDWEDTDRPPASAREWYNLRHSNLRVIVEHAFGWVKRRWKIIRSTAPEYSIEKQIQIVYAVTALHNFIRKHRHPEPELTEEQTEMLPLCRWRASAWVRGKTASQLRRQVKQRTWQGLLRKAEIIGNRNNAAAAAGQGNEAAAADEAD
jgi:DDE superfamily endonuclease